MSEASNGETSKEAVLEALANIQDPDLHRDIVSLGFYPPTTSTFVEAVWA